MKTVPPKISLEKHLKGLIAYDGPISVERYMGLCLAHYYGSRDPLGQRGDFVTAPEISQMFGELVGLWMADVWMTMGCPSPVRWVEFGPGRGTLTMDALRALRTTPDLMRALSVELIETSPALRQKQRETLKPFIRAGLSVRWHESLDEVPSGPCLAVANEFFDALPVRQFVAAADGWRERMVGLRDGQLVFGLAPEPNCSLPLPAIGEPETILEWPGIGLSMAADMAGRLAENGGVALIIDYGYWGYKTGDTLQALRAHAFADPLAQPGEADLTTHVDFRHLAQAAQDKGALAHGVSGQGEFLMALGIIIRAAHLKRSASPGEAAAIDAALARLTGPHPGGMGDLFKVLAIADRTLAAIPALQPLAS